MAGIGQGPLADAWNVALSVSMISPVTVNCTSMTYEVCLFLCLFVHTKIMQLSGFQGVTSFFGPL